MLKVIVIDDNLEVRKKHCTLIKNNCPNLTLVGEAHSVESGIKVIEQFSPDIVFLDTQFSDGSSFDLLEKLSPNTFKLIFITDCENSAVKAFRFSAVDYLLKPLKTEDLIEAVKKAEESLRKELFDIKFSYLFSNPERPKNIQKLRLKTTDKIYSVNIQDIVNCQSEKNYTTFHFINAPKLVVSTNLKEYENILTPFNFFRTHQSHLINMSYFDHYVKSDGGNTVMMKNNAAIPLSVRKKEEFLALLDHLHV